MWPDRGRRCHVCCVHRVRDPIVCVWGTCLVPESRDLGAHERFVWVCACAPKVWSHWPGLEGVMCGIRWLHAPSGTGASSRGPSAPPGPLRLFAALARPHRLGRCKPPPGVRRAGKGKRACSRALGPAPTSRRLTWARPHLLCGRGLFGGVFWRAWRRPAEPGGAQERAGGPSFQGFLGLPRSRPRRSRPGARRPRVRVGVRRGESVQERGREPACASARPRSALRALCGPASAAAPRGSAGPRPARPEPPRGECKRTRPAGGGTRARRGLACRGTQVWADSERDRGRPPAGSRRLVLAGQLEDPGGNRNAWAPEGEVQLL